MNVIFKLRSLRDWDMAVESENVEITVEKLQQELRVYFGNHDATMNEYDNLPLPILNGECPSMLDTLSIAAAISNTRRKEVWRNGLRQMALGFSHFIYSNMFEACPGRLLTKSPSVSQYKPTAGNHLMLFNSHIPVVACKTWNLER